MADITAPATSPGPLGRARPIVVWAICLGAIGLMIVLLAVQTVAASQSVPWSPTFVGAIVTIPFLAMVSSFSVVGAILLTRIPGNRVGWLLWWTGILQVVAAIGLVYPMFRIETGQGPSAAATFFAWAALWSLQLVLIGIVGFLPLIFPAGRLPSRRWRLVAAVYAVVGVVQVVGVAFMPGPLSDTYPVENPFGLEVVGRSQGFFSLFTSTLVVVILPVSVFAAVVRFRTGDDLVRQQVKWFAAAVSLSVVLLILATIGPAGDATNVIWVMALLSLPILPIAIGIAILRYRLYEIDRIVSRTVSWAIVTGGLVVAFVVLVVGLQSVLAPITEGNTLAVAVSTLVVAALFQPIRRWVQAAVDRRFDRARHDGEELASAFADRLRAEVSLETISRDMVGTIDAAVRPTGVGLWLRGGPAGRPDAG